MSNNSANNPSETGSDGKPSWLWLVAGLAVAGLGVAIMMFAGAKGGPDEAAASQEDSVPYVETVRPEAAGRTYQVKAAGRLQPREQLQLVGEVSGKVTGMHPNLVAGGRVGRGETLLTIDDGDFQADLERAQAQVATAEARLKQAEAERDRQLRLAELGAAPEKAAEQAVAAFEDAQAGLQQARSQQTIARRTTRKASITAPFDAIVTEESVAMGTFVSPGQPLATLISAEEGELQAGLPAEDVSAVRNALKALDGERLSVEARPNSSSLGSLVLDGYLSEFSPVIDQQSRTATVIAVFPDAFIPEHDGDVFAGDYMDLVIEGRSAAPLWLLPDGSMRQDEYVWLVGEDEQLQRVDVDPVNRTEDGVLVLSDGLDAQSRLLLTVLAEEIEGMRVHLSESAP